MLASASKTTMSRKRDTGLWWQFSERAAHIMHRIGLYRCEGGSDGLETQLSASTFLHDPYTILGLCVSMTLRISLSYVIAE